MLSNEDKPGRIERMLARLPEAFFLRSILLGLIGATIFVVGMDLREMLDAESMEWIDPRTSDPGPMARPAPSDHIRPYLPRSQPVTRDGGKPKLPGLPNDYDEGALQKRLAFFLGDDGAVTALGRIEPGAAGDFERFMMENKGKVSSVVLHSPGGSVRDALELGTFIREKKLETQVPTNGYCASSCPLVFASGVKRETSTDAWIGVHQVYTSSSTVGTIHDGLAEAQQISATCQQYLIDMGVDGQVWTHAMRTPKQKLYVFTPEQLIELKLATTVDGYDPENKKKAKKKRPS